MDIDRREFLKKLAASTTATALFPNILNANFFSSSDKPNILLILNDDMGYSDLGCYGGEVQTPNLDSLAANGLRYTQFYNTARCCPSRASLLTGLYPQQAGVGHMQKDDGIDGYRGNLSHNAVTIAEALRSGGYATYMTGKWHISTTKDNWPSQRGFDDYYGTITGAANYFQPRIMNRNNERILPEGDDYYFTDVISEESIRQLREHTEKNPDKPFFQYIAYTAPHWPLHALPEDIAKYKGRYNAGWDQMRRERRQRMIDMGILQEDWELTERDSRVPPWEEAENKEWQTRRMEVYAAQIDRMDQGIGRILQTLKDNGQWENTLIIFLADNGGCAEVINEDWKNWMVPYIATEKTRNGRDVQFGNNPSLMPGGEETYQSYGIAWANVSNTPFRLYKHWIHEGGISTPFIAHWPAGISAKNELRHQPAQLPDIMTTFLDIANVEYPSSYNGFEIKPAEGFSMTSTFKDNPHKRDVLYWEHEGNKAVRRGKWKLVRKYPGDWELYDIEADRTEINNIVNDYPEIVRELTKLYEQWADRCDVIPWTELRELRKKKRESKK